MAALEERISSYVAEMDSVPGWLSHDDVTLFERIGLIQAASGVTGDILEIGVFMGKSAIVLGHLLADDETLVAADLFDDDVNAADNAAEVAHEYPGLNEQRFLDNYNRFHAKPPEVIKGLSSKLPKVLGRRKFRLVHIDGSHTYEAVRDDIANSRHFAGPDAIIVMDDWRTVHTPGVSAAVWESVTREGLIPLVTSDAKFYACWYDGPVGVGGFLREWVRENFPERHQSHWIAGHELVRIGTPPTPVL